MYVMENVTTAPTANAVLYLSGHYKQGREVAKPTSGKYRAPAS